MTYNFRTLFVGLALTCAYVLTANSLHGHARATRYFTDEIDRVNRRHVDEDSKVNNIVESLIDLMFKERKVTEAFERYFLFVRLSPKREELIDPTSLHYLREYTVLDEKTAARLLAKRWNYEYQTVVLALGTRPLAEFDVALEESGTELDAARRRILSDRGLSPEGFNALLGGSVTEDHEKLRRDLLKLELINSDIDQFIAQRTNQLIFQQNLAEMKKTFTVKKFDRDGEIFYGVRIKPQFTVVFMRYDKTLKIVSFGDVQ